MLTKNDLLNDFIFSLAVRSEPAIDYVLQILIILCAKISSGTQLVIHSFGYFATERKEKRYQFLVHVLRHARMRSVRENTLFLINELLEGEGREGFCERMELRREFIHLSILDVIDHLLGFFVFLIHFVIEFFLQLSFKLCLSEQKRRSLRWDGPTN